MAQPDIIELTGPSSNLKTAPDYYDSAAEEDSAVVKAAPGVLYGFSGYNNDATGGALSYIQVFDATSLPANATAVTKSIIVPVYAGQPFAFDAGKYGIPFSTGIVIAASSTDITLTVKTDTEFLFGVSYK